MPLGIFAFLFGCYHRQKTGIFTIKNRTYQVCLNCGKEFDYSWKNMRSVRSSACRVTDLPTRSVRHPDDVLT